MTMSNALKWNLETSADGTTVHLSGAITEDSDLGRLATELQNAQTVRFYLNGVARINSVGVRDWILFLGEVTRGKQVELLECPPVLVAQMNMITNFTQNTRVVSIQMPFCCEACDKEIVISCDVSSGEPPTELPTPVCDEDGTEMIFDDLPELYFRFLKSTSKLAS